MRRTPVRPQQRALNALLVHEEGLDALVDRCTVRQRPHVPGARYTNNTPLGKGIGQHGYGLAQHEARVAPAKDHRLRNDARELAGRDGHSARIPLMAVGWQLARHRLLPFGRCRR